MAELQHNDVIYTRYIRGHTRYELLMRWLSAGAVGSSITGQQSPFLQPPEQCDEQLSHGDFFVLSSSPQGQKCVQWSVLFWQGVGFGLFFFKNQHVSNILVAMCSCQPKPGRG